MVVGAVIDGNDIFELTLLYGDEVVDRFVGLSITGLEGSSKR